jgi:hypothetical protein
LSPKTYKCGASFLYSKYCEVLDEIEIQVFN